MRPLCAADHAHTRWSVRGQLRSRAHGRRGEGAAGFEVGREGTWDTGKTWQREGTGRLGDTEETAGIRDRLGVRRRRHRGQWTRGREGLGSRAWVSNRRSGPSWVRWPARLPPRFPVSPWRAQRQRPHGSFSTWGSADEALCPGNCPCIGAYAPAMPRASLCRGMCLGIAGAFRCDLPGHPFLPRQSCAPTNPSPGGRPRAGGHPPLPPFRGRVDRPSFLGRGSQVKSRPTADIKNNANPRIEITPSVAEYEQLCRDLKILRRSGANSNTVAILDAVRAAASSDRIGVRSKRGKGARTRPQPSNRR